MMAKMTEREKTKRNIERQKLERDLDGLNESIRLNWVELDSKNLKEVDRAGIRRAIGFLMAELEALLRRLDELDRHATA
jgi:hypothetical protein